MAKQFRNKPVSVFDLPSAASQRQLSMSSAIDDGIVDSDNDDEIY